MKQSKENESDKKPIDFVCENCGGKNVWNDATAAWCPIKQKWELNSMQDMSYCEDCGGEVWLKEIPFKQRSK